MDIPPRDSTRLQHLAHFRRQMNRQLWSWSLGGFLLYAVLAAACMLALRMHPIMLSFTLNLILLFAIVLILVSLSRRQFSGLLNETEQTEIERMREAAVVHQFEGVQVTARAVAHTMNQPLTAALGYLALYQGADVAERDDQDLQRVRREIERVAALVRQFQQVNVYQTVPYSEGVEMLDLASDDPASKRLYQ